MRVAIGSTNPVKIAAVKQAFKLYFPDQDIEYQPLEVSSGVSDQPLTIKETMTGAINRAQTASNSGFDYSVGMEGGVDKFKIKDKVVQLEMAWGCVLDCRTKDYEIASAPGFVILPNIAKHLQDGKNLSDAMDIEYGLKDIGQKTGYIGWLTDDNITRQHLSHESVYLALCALLKEG